MSLSPGEHNDTLAVLFAAPFVLQLVGDCLHAIITPSPAISFWPWMTDPPGRLNQK
jgi:hypothetical protein